MWGKNVYHSQQDCESSTPNLRTIPSRTYIRKDTNMRAAAVVIVMQAMNPGARLLLSFCEDVGIAEEAMIYTWLKNVKGYQIGAGRIIVNQTQDYDGQNTD